VKIDACGERNEDSKWNKIVDERRESKVRKRKETNQSLRNTG
jgi:hypothetical protein